MRCEYSPSEVLTPQAGHENALWQRRIDYLNELRQQTKEAAQ